MAAKAKSDGAPARPSLRERNRLRTRRELLDAALAVFAESGYGSATVENIAARAGASKVTLYSYFPQGREELFRELYEEINDEVIEKVTAAYAREGDFPSHVVAVTEAVLEIAQRPLIGRFYSIDDPVLDEALTPVRGHASHLCADLISTDLAAAQKAGVVKASAEPGAIGELLVGAIRSALSEVARERAKPADILNAMHALVSGLRGP
ncbi:MAG TPA: TetR/AcrR family transcriptional regulator [Amycolatopsis sp.]|uniref:TetR/AcrR family transcriptional regulator n=1 Tax=Amycolatopsis sp. TaxID=37632 RepID=UPI002B469998|nr:TetR/AcrR family transcriptional regulator [Amycolatopsis sp.]HKS50189.1 TetR/AcrR family transcriptional regulator [Amycolatopsis sp.]